MVKKHKCMSFKAWNITKKKTSDAETGNALRVLKVKRPGKRSAATDQIVLIQGSCEIAEPH